MSDLSLFLVGSLYSLITFAAVWMVARFEPGRSEERPSELSESKSGSLTELSPKSSLEARSRVFLN